MNLTAERVHELMLACLFKPEEVIDGQAPEGAVMVQGLVRSFGFHPGRVAENREAIRTLLRELPDEFQASKGGGYSFLNMPFTRNGEQWGEQSTAEALLCLGIAAGVAKMLPRELWPTLPGGVPYVQVLDVPLEV